MTILLRLSAGLVAWTVAFAAIYGLHGIGCAAGWQARAMAGTDLQRLALFGAWFGAVAATAALAWWLSRRRATLLDRVAAAVGWIAVAATIVTFAPIAAVPACI